MSEKEVEVKGTEAVEDVVKEPQHYQHGSFEVIDEMLIAFGARDTFMFCVMNAWKYRSRALFKGNAGQDLDKANRYMEMARQIQVRNADEVDGIPMYPQLIKAKGK